MEKKEAVNAGVGSIPRKDPQPVVRLPLFLLRAKRSKLERSEAKLLAAKRTAKNAQELRRGIDRDSRLFVRMPRGDGALKEMERNGETQNRRSGSRVGVNDCW